MTDPASTYAPTGRTRLARRPRRGVYDRVVVHAILDAGIIGHIGYVVDGAPVVVPTVYWRAGERVFWHGSAGGRTAAGIAGSEVCLAVSHLDGLVLGRSAFRHSANYRSVMAFGAAREVQGEGGKVAALKAMIERLYPGRWDRIRQPSPAELAAVSVLYIELEEVSAKVREGPPLDAEDDLARAVWAGVMPLALRPGPLEACERMAADIPVPDTLAGWAP